MGEILIILVLALIFIGPKKLPELAKNIGKGLREFQRAKQGLMDSIEISQFEEEQKEKENEKELKKSGEQTIEPDYHEVAGDGDHHDEFHHENHSDIDHDDPESFHKEDDTHVAGHDSADFDYTKENKPADDNVSDADPKDSESLLKKNS